MVNRRTQVLLLASAALVALCGAGCGTQAATQADIDDAESNPYTPEPGGIAEIGTPSTEKSCGGRTDFVKEITVGSGNWGYFASCFDWCPAGSFAYAINLKSETSQGSGDDSAVNGVSLWCFNRNDVVPGHQVEYVESVIGGSGTWQMPETPTNPFQSNNPIMGGALKTEISQGSGDDTSVNGLRFSDKIVGGYDTFIAKAATNWGSFPTVDPKYDAKCPAGTAVCGIKTQVEPNQGTGDDTRLNGVAFACCAF